MEQLSIYLLGTFNVRSGEQVLSGAFRTKKERALLAYLAVESQQRHRREAVAEMLWPGRPEGYARTNLRQALLGLRRAIGDDHIHITDDVIQFQPAKSVWLDVDTFRTSYLRTLHHPHPSLDYCPECASDLLAAVDIYRGEFLGEISLADAQGFQEWCVFHREQHFRYLLAALQNLSDYSRAQRDYEQAYQYTWRYVNLAPLEETAHRQLMTILALSDRRSAALEQYHTCRGLLAKELGVEPSADTVDLYEKIRAGRMVEEPRPGPRPIPSNLPDQLTSFIGREMELTQLEDCLENPACRLISLKGMAGAGKTRLALNVAGRKLERFPDGVWYTALGESLARGGLAEKMLTSLGVTVQLEIPLRDQLLNRIRGMNTLLVLDNFEHYLDETSLLIEILQGSPQVKILLTTQDRLNYQASCVFNISGLPCGECEPQEEALESPAVRLFLARARHSRTGFAVNQDNLVHVRRICRQVEGLPLAVELAAAALREHRCEEIAAALEHDLGVLKTSMLDLPPDHRSMQAALDRAWQRLTPEQRSLMVGLAQSPDEVTPEEAGTSQDELDALVDRSMLSTASPGRYRLPSLIRLLVEGKISEGDQDRPPLHPTLPGRGMYWDRVEHMLARAGRYGQTAAVMMVVLEGGDSAGSRGKMYGDTRFDQAVLRRLLGCLRKSDTAVRLDRGAFGLILEDLSRARDSLKVAQKIHAALSEPVILGDESIKPVFHVGISIYPRDGQDAEILMQRAEKALQSVRRGTTWCMMYGQEGGEQ